MRYQVSPRSVLKRAFPGILEEDVFEMAAVGRVKEYPSGTVLCREGAQETIFYILLDGSVEVTKVIGSQQNRVMKQLTSGAFFGEMALIHNAPRSATVTSISPVAVLEIRAEDFHRLLERSSSLSIAMVREVSRRLRQNDDMAIEDLREKAGELAEAYQHLAEMEFARQEFLSTVAHELRTPLTSASGFLQLIQKGSLQGEQLTSALDKVSANIQDIVTLTNDFLFLQEMKLILPEFQPLDIGQILTQMVEECRDRAERAGVKLNLAIKSYLPMVAGDPRSIRRVFAAILDNAIKFSPDGGDIEVGLRGEERHVVAWVTDHGVGIPEDYLGCVFERFFHLSEVNGHLFRGVGLGLAIARQVVDQHNGRIEVDSQLGQGSTFRVYLPVNLD